MRRKRSWTDAAAPPANQVARGACERTSATRLRRLLRPCAADRSSGRGFALRLRFGALRCFGLVRVRGRLVVDAWLTRPGRDRLTDLAEGRAEAERAGDQQVQRYLRVAVLHLREA